MDTSDTSTLEPNAILNVDCLEGMAQMAGGSVDLIFCDLPYGVTARNNWDREIDAATLWAHYERVIKPNGAIILFGQDKFTARMIMSNEKLYHYSLVWQKTHPVGFLNANRRPMKAHEDIMVFYKKQPVYNPQKTGGHARKVSTARHKRGCSQGTNYGEVRAASYDSTERFPTSVLTFKDDKQTHHYHPTQKPLALCRYIVRAYSNPGDLVLDNCCGSGTIPLAAKLEGRRYIGMDNGCCEDAKSAYFGRSWASVAEERIATSAE